MTGRLANKSGFTLIEIMVVIVILALLAALVGPKLIGRSDDARVADAKVQIRNIETALKLYKLDSSAFPTTEQGLATEDHRHTPAGCPFRIASSLLSPQSRNRCRRRSSRTRHMRDQLRAPREPLVR